MWQGDATLEKERLSQRHDPSAATSERWRTYEAAQIDPFSAVFSTAKMWMQFVESQRNLLEIPPPQELFAPYRALLLTWSQFASGFSRLSEAVVEDRSERQSLGPSTMASRFRLKQIPEAGSAKVVPFPSRRETFRFSDTIRQIEALPERAILEGASSEARLKDAVADALKFIAQLPSTASAPSVSAADDGEVVLEWAVNSKRAVASFEGDGRFGYALLKEAKFMPGEHEGRLDQPLPADLVQYLHD